MGTRQLERDEGQGEPSLHCLFWEVGSLNIYEPNTNRLPREQRKKLSMSQAATWQGTDVSEIVRSTRVQGQISERRDPALHMLEAPRPTGM